MWVRFEWEDGVFEMVHSMIRYAAMVRNRFTSSSVGAIENQLNRTGHINNYTEQGWGRSDRE